MSTSTRCRAFSILALVAAIAIGVRIWSVNQNQLSIPVEHYAMGEWVELNGAFLYDSQEATQGYSVRITSAEVISSDEYLDRYAPDADRSQITIGPGDVLVLGYDVRNVGNSTGYIDLVMQMVVGSAKNTFYKVDDELWSAAEPPLKDAPVLILVPDSEYSTHGVVSLTADPDYLEKFDTGTQTYDTSTSSRADIRETSFELILTNAPVRKVVDITLT